MLSIIDAARSILSEDDVALEAMHTGILNLSAYADTILSRVEQKTWKTVKKTSVVVALSRIAEEIQGNDAIRPEVELDDLSIRSPLCDITFPKTPQTRQKIIDLHQKITIGENAFFTITQSMTEITIISPEHLLNDILNHFDTPTKSVFSDRAGITVRFSEKYLAVPNVLFSLQAALAVHKINFTEIISTYTEFSFIIEKKQLDTAVQALQKFLK